MKAAWVDGHVHFYPCFALHTFLDAARKNLAAAGLTEGVGVLLMAQVDADEHPLTLIQQQLEECDHGWTCRTTDSAEGIICDFDGNASLVMIAGRQVVTNERLELLALCTAERISHGLSLQESIRNTRNANAVPVLPWGFGKWWFHRGRILRDFLQSKDAETEILLGDNGGRPTLFGGPTHLRQGEARGIAVLAGSDPLNVPGYENRVCRYGSVLHEEMDLGQPVEWMRNQLLGLTKSPPLFGRCRSVRGFVADQIRLRTRK